MKDLSIKTWCLLHFLQASIGFFSLIKTCFGYHHHLYSLRGDLSVSAKEKVTKSLSCCFDQVSWCCRQAGVSPKHCEEAAHSSPRNGTAPVRSSIILLPPSRTTVPWRNARNCCVEKRRTRHRCTGDTVTCSYLDADISELTTTNNNHRWLQTISYGHHRRSPFFILVSDLYNVSMEQVTVWNYHCPPGNGTEPKSTVPIGFVFTWLEVPNYMLLYLYYISDLRNSFVPSNWLKVSSLYEWAFRQENLS